MCIIAQSCCVDVGLLHGMERGTFQFPDTTKEPTMPASVTHADPSERARCIGALVAAFTTDPLLRWVLPDPACYLEFFPRVLQHYGGGAFDHDSAYRSTDFGATALWLPPGVGSDEAALGAVMEEAVDPGRLGEVFGLLEQVGKAHPEEPHWFLPAIGVDPILQGRGYGSRLLELSLEACDRSHSIAYLEASNPRNVPLYRKFGFEISGHIQLGSSPVVVPMRRAAR